MFLYDIIKYLFTHVVHVPIQGSCNKIVYYISNISLSDFSIFYFNVIRLKAQPHAAALHTCDGVVQSSCDAGQLLAMLCDVNSNMFNKLPILEYPSHLYSDFLMVCISVMGI